MPTTPPTTELPSPVQPVAGTISNENNYTLNFVIHDINIDTQQQTSTPLKCEIIVQHKITNLPILKINSAYINTIYNNDLKLHNGTWNFELKHSLKNLINNLNDYIIYLKIHQMKTTFLSTKEIEIAITQMFNLKDFFSMPCKCIWFDLMKPENQTNLGKIQLSIEIINEIEVPENVSIDLMHVGEIGTKCFIIPDVLSTNKGIKMIQLGEQVKEWLNNYSHLIDCISIIQTEEASATTSKLSLYQFIYYKRKNKNVTSENPNILR
ncbi:hypothetical protein ABK040_016713 [Willaertia magna]